MTNIRTPPPIQAPATWLDADFSLKDLARFTGVAPTTIDFWMQTGRLCGQSAGLKKGRNRYFATYHLFVVALLAKLQKVGLPIAPGIIASAFRHANDEFHSPRAYFLPDEVWTVADEAGATVTVDAWLAFVAARAWAEGERAKHD